MVRLKTASVDLLQLHNVGSKQQSLERFISFGRRRDHDKHSPSAENGVGPARRRSTVALRGERSLLSGSLSLLFCRLPQPNAAAIAPALFDAALVQAEITWRADESHKLSALS
jgi:hypothetical protein